MFLYEYQLSRGNEITKHIIEVDEKPNTYKVKGRHSSLAYRSVFQKAEEGTILSNYDMTLYLDEDNDERARKIMMDAVETEIDNFKATLTAKEDKLKQISVAKVIETI